MPSLAELLQSNARAPLPNGRPYQQPGSLQAMLVDALRGPQAGLMYGNPQARNMMQVPAQPFGNMGIHAWPNPGERMPNAYGGVLQEPNAVGSGDVPNVAGPYNMQPVADTQFRGSAGVGPDGVVRSGAQGAPAQAYSSPNVTAGRAAQTDAQRASLAQLLMQRGIPEAQARAMAAAQR